MRTLLAHAGRLQQDGDGQTVGEREQPGCGLPRRPGRCCALLAPGSEDEFRDAVLGALPQPAVLLRGLLPRRWRPAGRPGRVRRWRDEQLREGASVRPLLMLALVAVALEALTMLPYIGAVALLAAADLSGPVTAGLLAAYCLGMVLPALLLLAVRRLAARRVDPLLSRLERLAARGGTEASLWAVFIVGFLLARDAAFRLGLLGG